MLQRWSYRSEIRHTVIRLASLIVTMSLIIICIASFQLHPILIQIFICCTLLCLNIATIRQREGEPKKPYQHLFLPLIMAMGCSAYILIGQIDFFQYRSLLLMHHREYALDTTTDSIAGLTVLVLIMSSWEAAEKRQLLRDTTLHWMGNEGDTTFIYRFVVGQPPSARIQSQWGSKLIFESEKYHDLIVVPASDLQSDKSKKVFEAIRWAASSVQHDYLIKTDDDVFVRYDIVRQELEALGKKDNYWQGFVYRNMPAQHMELDYAMPVLPTYTSSTFYTVSRNIVELIGQINYPQRFVDADDVNLSMWLFGFDIEPVHDIRIQHLSDVCEDNLIAKRLTLEKMRKEIPAMYNNVLNKLPQCKGLALVRKCALCYPCYDKLDDWRTQGLQCDVGYGVSPLKQPSYKKIATMPVKDKLEPSVIGENDQWIIKDVISTRTSVYTEDEANWHLLYWVCWTSDPSTFTDRHWRALEMVWIHEPQAAIFMISNTLPEHFFHEYTRRGYNIQVVQFNKENLLKWKWYFGPGTQDWLQKWDKWEKGKFFYWHLTDYIRCLLLYNYGGTYMDMDALWIRIPPDSNMEFIGSDYSSVSSDLEWTLDDKGLYLPQGLMRFKRGWKLFREMAEGAFSAYIYDPECFNCGGPKAITSYVRDRRGILEEAGLTILPRQVLYPFSYLDIHQLLQPNPLSEQELKLRIEPLSWNIHLFGKMTNHLPVQLNSVIDYVFRKFDLDLPHRDTRTHRIISSTQSMDVPMDLVGPRDYIYRTISEKMLQNDRQTRNVLRLRSTPGKFQGLDVIYVRGGPDIVTYAKIELETAIGKTSILNGTHEKLLTHTMENTPMQQINHVLNSIEFQPTPLMFANGGRDRLKVTVTFDQDNQTTVKQLQITIIIVEPEEPDQEFSEDLNEEEKKILFNKHF